MKDREDVKDDKGKELAEEEMVEGQAALTELPEEEAARLRQELLEKKKEAGDNYERFLRACADLENYKKRVEKEKAEMLSYGNAQLIEAILPVFDNLDRAIEHANNEAGLEKLRQGVKLTVGQFFAELKKFGLEEIKSVGQKFDPAAHHAISHEECGTVLPGMVVREFQKGFFLKGRLLRPAMVCVSKEKEKEQAR